MYVYGSIVEPSGFRVLGLVVALGVPFNKQSTRADHFLRICNSLPPHAQLTEPIDLRMFFDLYPGRANTQRWEWEPGPFEDMVPIETRWRTRPECVCVPVSALAHGLLDFG